MSDDLIRRNSLLDKLRENVLIDVTEELEITIDEQPIAYDVEKVAEQLEELRDRFNKEDFHIRGIIEKTIEIVRGGGVEK